MNKLTRNCLSILAAAMAFTACSKSSDNTTTPTPGQEPAKGNYVIFSNSADLNTTGYMAAYTDMPKGNLSNIGANTLQMKSAFGFTAYSKWIFNRTSIAGETGIQKLAVGENGKITSAGFIANGAMFNIISETNGYYLDPVRNAMAIQVFNPTTMQRTGEIDLSALKMPGAEYQAMGQHIIASKEGKLYVSTTYGTKTRFGFGDDIISEIRLAVIDIATNKYEKTIKYPGLKSLGWGASANKMWTLGDDGALYFYYTGFNEGIANSAIIRIKKGETEFDASWILKADKLQAKSTIGTSLVKNGKIYIQLPSEPLAPDFSNLGKPIWDYYAVDINTLQKTKIAGVSKTRYAHSNEQCIIQIDGKIYLWVANELTKENGYYLLNETSNTASPAFNVTDGGLISGFVKLSI